MKFSDLIEQQVDSTQHAIDGLKKQNYETKKVGDDIYEITTPNGQTFKVNSNELRSWLNRTNKLTKSKYDLLKK